VASTTRKTIHGVTFEFTLYAAPEGRYYRVAVQDVESPVGFFNYLDRFRTKAKAMTFARNLAHTYALAGV